MVKRKKSPEYKVRGIIVPVDWDENGNVIGLTLQTTNEEEYFIDQNRKGEELVAFIHHKVEVAGTVREGAYGNALINVKRFRLIGANHDEQMP